MHEVSTAGLVAYRIALAVAAGQHFSLSGAVAQFVIAAAGGVAVGCIVGMAVIAVHKRMDEPLIETVVTLLTPFAAYLDARLALLAAGNLYLDRRKSEGGYGYRD